MTRPLKWESLSAPSKIMLPTYVIGFFVIGFVYTSTDKEDLVHASLALHYANDWIDIRIWGAMFLTISMTMTLSFLFERRALFSYALWYAAVVLASWMIILIAAAFNGSGTFAGWVWPYIAASACIASFTSLLKDDLR